MKKVALLGECMIELNGEPFGGMQQTFGGDSLNTALYLARSTSRTEVNVHYVSVMGKDALSSQIIKLWQAEGIDTSLVLIDDQRQPGLYLIQLDAKGERTFLYWRNESAARYLLQHPDFAKVALALSKMDVIYLSGISLAILPPADRVALVRVLTELSHLGKPIIFDSNYRPALWESPAEARACYQEVLAFTDVALVTDDDERALWGDISTSHTLQRLRSAGVHEAVIKQGGEGCVYQELLTDQPTITIPAEPVPAIVDTTSAGDAFNAGFLAGYLLALSPELCARMGHILASKVIQHKGAIVPEDATRDTTTTFKAIR
ncbi:sugar kinase [Aeromonas veronii]|uniref:sugar kinase n=1 Tax=Aeromonas veronii TaxID=654 RepID=UPI003D1DF804